MEPTPWEIAVKIENESAAVADAITAEHYRRHPEYLERFGPAGRLRCAEDARYHLAYLANALGQEAVGLFADYVAWAAVMLESRRVPREDLAAHLTLMVDALATHLPPGMHATVRSFVDSGIRAAREGAPVPGTFLTASGPVGVLAYQYLQALMRGERRVALRLVTDAVRDGMGVKVLYMDVFQRCQHEIGLLWQRNRITVAQEHYATAATQLVMSQLYERILSVAKTRGTLVATCVTGDLHELGIRMVADFFELEGWNTYYLGANMPIGSVVSALVERRADVLGISVTMAFHVNVVAELIAAVRADDRTRGVQVMVGGYPFLHSDDLWRKVGADGHAQDAQGAVDLGNRWFEERPR